MKHLVLIIISLLVGGIVLAQGVMIEFIPADQKITEISAQLIAQVSVTLPMNIDLVWSWGETGTAFTNEEMLINVPNLPAGYKHPALLVFPNLTPDTSYSFNIRNKVTGSNHPGSFTSLGGEAGMTDPTAIQLEISPDSQSFTDPGGFTGVEDTISDKGIVPKCSRTAGPGVTAEETEMCGYKDFLQLIANVIQYAVIIIAPIIAIMVMYAGAMIIWLGKIPDKTSAQMKKLREYQGQLVRIAIGILIMLSSYMIVATILRELGVQSSHILLNLFG